MSVHLWNKWLWNWLLLQLLKLSILHLFQIRSSLTFDNCRVYIYSKTWMWHDKKNSELKNFLPLYTVLLIYSKVNASQIFPGGINPVAPIKNGIQAIYSSDEKNISYFSYLFGSKKSQEKSYLPTCFTKNSPQVTDKILWPTTFVTK